MSVYDKPQDPDYLNQSPPPSNTVWWIISGVIACLCGLAIPAATIAFAGVTINNQFQPIAASQTASAATESFNQAGYSASATALMDRAFVDQGPFGSISTHTPVPLTSTPTPEPPGLVPVDDSPPAGWQQLDLKFASGGGVWPEGHQENPYVMSGDLRFEGEQYVWKVATQSIGKLIVPAEGVTLSDFYLSVDITIRDAGAQSTYPLIVFRRSSSQKYLGIRIHQGWVDFFPVTNGVEGQSIEQGVVYDYDTGWPDGKPIHITILGIGSKFYVFVGGRKYITASHPGWESGEVGLGVESVMFNRRLISEYAFENLVVYAPPE